MKRPSKDQYYLNIAKAVLSRSTCLRRQYGAVIVKDDEIIATGYNGAPRGDVNCLDTGICPRIAKNIPQGERYEECVAVHAEQNAIISAARKDMVGATLYLYGENYNKSEFDVTLNAAPCKICKQLIKNSGIARIVNIYGDVKL